MGGPAPPVTLGGHGGACRRDGGAHACYGMSGSWGFPATPPRRQHLFYTHQVVTGGTLTVFL